MNLAKIRKLTYYCIAFSIILDFCCEKSEGTTPIPPNCHQIILVLTDTLKASKGTLYYFERDNTKSDWILVNDKTPVVIGRNGLGWGIGLHDVPNRLNFPIKEEGDGRSPSGIFRLSSVFGYKPADQMKYLKMPYIHITELIECIDDIASQYYNQIVSKDTIEDVDWQSSEKMNLAGIYYELGVVVDHNRDPIKKGSGSCIFLHNWSTENGTTAGCTGMAPPKMREIVYWLDEAKNPILIQLTKQLYLDLINQWKLPKIPENVNTE